MAGGNVFFAEHDTPGRTGYLLVMGNGRDRKVYAILTPDELPEYVEKVGGAYIASKQAVLGNKPALFVIRYSDTLSKLDTAGLIIGESGKPEYVVVNTETLAFIGAMEPMLLRDMSHIEPFLASLVGPRTAQQPSQQRQVQEPRVSTATSDRQQPQQPQIQSKLAIMVQKARSQAPQHVEAIETPPAEVQQPPPRIQPPRIPEGRRAAGRGGEHELDRLVVPAREEEIREAIKKRLTPA